MKRNLTWAFVVLGLVTGCHKVPLRESWGDFNLVSSHWFENEKTQYVFFSIDGLRADQASSNWPSQFEMSVNGKEYEPLDFSKAVHRHHIVPCAEGKLCGSYSFKAEKPVSSLKIRFRYHKESPLSRERWVSTSVHRESSGKDAQSALVYGVFNSTNERIQFRVHDNFGSPNSEEILQYGMEREFEISDVELKDISPQTLTEGRAKTETGFLFPATACLDGAVPAMAAATTAKAASHRFSGHESWWSETVEGQLEKGTACFKARLLDRGGSVIKEESALARRNPVLQDENLTVQAPLKEARRIPLVFSYCQGRPESANLTSNLFLDYQRFILGIVKNTVDACFAIGEEERFATDVARVVKAKIDAARATGGQDSDFIFVIAINQKLSPVVRKFHQIILSELDRQIRAESVMVSPRLVGAFVYDSAPLEARELTTSSGVIWCPRRESESSANGGSAGGGVEGADDASANCVGYRGGQADLGILNFIIPMGPFPTLSAYEDHVRHFGDKGLSRNPSLFFQSVHTNVNSLNLKDSMVTFFDGERVNVGDGESLRFCGDRDKERMLDQMAFRMSVDGVVQEGLLPKEQAQYYALNNRRDRSFEIGLRWEQPYWGGLTIESPVEGKILSVIPISAGFESTQKIGDPKWTRQTWQVGPLMQKCLRYCDHPVFDEAGVYQVNTTWRNYMNGCPQPKPVEPQ